MEYIVFIHNNTDEKTTAEQWDSFFALAKSSGIFQGGSEISNQVILGKKSIAKFTDNIGGYMRFETEDKNKLLLLLDEHPVIINGGSLELCEMPKT